ncbi:MAG: hypothetical protein FVQ83_13310 [Chloroflexi bacterium]|nr:hypothetical protein [Chloroflexota bacterium]
MTDSKKTKAQLINELRELGRELEALRIAKPTGEDETGDSDSKWHLLFWNKFERVNLYKKYIQSGTIFFLQSTQYSYFPSIGGVV